MVRAGNSQMAEKYDLPILYSCHPRSRNRLAVSGFKLDKACFFIADIEENVSIKVTRIINFILRNFATYGLQGCRF